MRKIKVAFRLEMILLLLLISLNSMLPFALAANDPGHDVLYIEQQGSSELNGTLNISQQLKVTDRLYSSYLEILGNGSQPTGSFPQIYASDANTLTINSVTSLYLLKDAGSIVYVGGTNVNLNISGALYFGGNNKLYTSAAAGQSNLSLYWGDKLLCNASQTNCGWISSVSGGDGNNYTLSIGFNVTGGSATLQLNRSGSANNLTATFLMNDTTRAYPTTCTGSQAIANTSSTGTGNCIAIQAGAEIGNCSADGSCPLITYDSETTNWDKDSSNDLTTSTIFSNASTSDINVSGTYNALDLQIKPDSIDGTELADTITLDTNLAITGYNVSFDSGTLAIDATNDKIGIGDTTPDALLDVQSSSAANQLRVSYDDSNYGNISVNSGGNMTIRATGHVIIDIS